MAEINESVAIPLPPERVWSFIAEPRAVAAMIPGAELGEPDADGVYPGTMTVKFGPTVAKFRGEATIAYDDAARRCVIEGRGIDQRGASRALGSATVSLAGADSTTLSIDGSYSVSGPLETFATMGGALVARGLLAEFAGNLARALTAEAAQPAAAAPSAPAPSIPSAAPAPQAPRSLSAMAMLRMLVRGWLQKIRERAGRRTAW